MTSPADCYRNWLKSLFWLQEFCQWDARSWSRSLWSFWHPLELTKQAPLPMLHHMSWWKDASPQGRLHLSQMPADATSNCCSTSINMLRDTTCITALYKAILRSKHSQNSFCWTSTFPGLNYSYFWIFYLFCFLCLSAYLPLFLTVMRWDRKIHKENIVVWQWHETPKLMLVCKSASCQKSFGWYSSCFVDFFWFVYLLVLLFRGISPILFVRPDTAAGSVTDHQWRFCQIGIDYISDIIKEIQWCKNTTAL